MTPSTVRMARTLVRHGQMPWKAGMLAVSWDPTVDPQAPTIRVLEDAVDGAWVVCIDSSVDRCVSMDLRGLIPDLDDEATQGCLLGLLLEGKTSWQSAQVFGGLARASAPLGFTLASMLHAELEEP